MFIGEAKLVADLVHQNIVQIYQLGKVGGLYYMAMEYVDGVHLEEFMKRHGERGVELPVDLAVYIVSRVCRGLEYAHNKRDRQGHLLGVVHRDISPKNVILSREGFVKLADFGIAKGRKQKKDLEGEVLMGKVRYMSPEQATFQKTDARSDLFSLGIVAYELLSGQVVFGADTTEDVLKAVTTRPVKPLREVRPDVPEEVARIVDLSLERDPAKRYQDAGQLALDLEHFMYHDRFGPTVVTLEKYLSFLFPERFPPNGA
jgi:serine/threonine-protein kinase